MFIKRGSIVTLNNNVNYLVLSKIKYNDEYFLYLINSDGKNGIKFGHEKEVDGNLKIYFIHDEKLIKNLLPLFLKDTKELF